MGHNRDIMDRDLLAKKASLTAGVIGAVMVTLICFGAALAFSNPAGAKTGQQSSNANASLTVQTDDQAGGK